jgi:toxin FitB
VTAGYLVDTNVLSELMRPTPSRNVLAFLESVSLDRILTADIMLAELRYGASLVTDDARRSGIFAAINESIRPMFRNRILSVSEATWVIWKRMEQSGRNRRYTFPQPDLVIAALAEEHDLTVLTRDITPCQEAGVAFLNPWES